ncbi:MAG: hypothetical protein H0Z32_03500 [Bacillaceae bacterium]|nr:hypothetical protein [Bacillaceae bacterium]
MVSKEQLELENYRSKNQLMFVLLVVSTVLATVVDIVIQRPVEVILTIGVGGGVISAIFGILHYFRKTTRFLPYLGILGLAVILFAIMFLNPGVQNIGLLYLLLAMSALYLERRILWTGVIISASLLISYPILFPSLDLKLSNALLVLILTVIVLVFQERISAKFNRQIDELQEEVSKNLLNEQNQRKNTENQASVIRGSMENIEKQSSANYQSYQEMNHAINEVASGTQSQAESIDHIRQSVKNTNTRIKEMLESAVSILSQTDQSARMWRKDVPIPKPYKRISSIFEKHCIKWLKTLNN